MHVARSPVLRLPDRLVSVGGHEPNGTSSGILLVMSIIPYDALRARGRDPGKRHPRSEGCLPVPVLAGSRGRVPFLRFLVILAGPVRGRVLVRLPDPFDAVDLLDILGDHGRDEGFPVASFQHSLADDGPGEPLAVQQGGREYPEAVFPEQAHYEIRIRVDAVKAGHERGHVAHPHTVDVGVRDRHDVIVVDPLRVEGPFDHLISLAGGERILPGVAVLGRSDPHDDLAVRLEDPLHRREVTPMERLEPTDEECAPAHSALSPRKWAMYGHSIVKNIRQWTHIPSSSAGARAGLDS